MRNHCKSIPDRSRPGLPTTASGVTQQGTCGNYATAKQSENKSRKRGGRRVKKQREAWKGRCSLIRVGTLNIGTMTGRGRELADMIVVVVVFIYRVQKLAINQRNENTLTKKSDEVKRKTIISSLMATRSPSLFHLKIERRNVDILCLQETKWKGSKARNIEGGCKIF